MSDVVGPDGRPFMNPDKALNIGMGLSEGGHIALVKFDKPTEEINLPAYEMVKLGHQLIALGLQGCQMQIEAAAKASQMPPLKLSDA